MKKADKIIEELKKFSLDIMAFGYPISDNRIVEFEKQFNLTLPNDYKHLIDLYNGIGLMGNEVYGIGPNINPAVSTETLEGVYEYEHFKVGIPQFLYLVPFSPDGGGNFYCFDTRTKSSDGNSCPVVFWVSNYQYTEEDAPEVTNESFLDWVQEVIIDWTLNDYDYEGNEKK